MTSPDGALLERATKKATRRLVPLLALLLFVNYIDRVNVGFAARSMNADLGISTAAYGTGVALFFVGYIILEVPSNYLMYRVGARIWITRIMVSWGIVAALHSAVQSETSFALARIALGIAEAGFIPGILLYLTLWFPVRTRTKVLGTYLVAVPLSTALGGPISAFLMTHGNGFLGLPGWRFMYAVEGLAAVLLGIVVVLALPNRPRDAKWLEADEQQALEDGLSADNSAHSDRAHSFGEALRDRRTIVLAVMFFLVIFPMFSISFFLPLVIQGMQKTTGYLSDTQVSLITFVPFSLGALASWWATKSSQRHNERVWHFAIPAALAGMGVIVCAFSASSIWLLLVAISVAAIGIYAAIPVFWSLSGTFLIGAAAASGLALINSVGSLGGFTAGYLTGWLRDATGNYQLPFIIMGISLFVAAVIAIANFGRPNIGRPRNDAPVKRQSFRG